MSTITLTTLFRLGDGDLRFGVKLFFREKCVESGTRWTSSPSYYVNRAIDILKAREGVADLCDDDLVCLLRAPEAQDEGGATPIERSEDEISFEKDAGSRGIPLLELYNSLFGPSELLPQASSQEEDASSRMDPRDPVDPGGPSEVPMRRCDSQQPDQNLNVEKLQSLLRSARLDDVSVSGVLCRTRVKTFLRHSCREKGITWTTNPTFFVERALGILSDSFRDRLSQYQLVHHESGNTEPLGDELDESYVVAGPRHENLTAGLRRKLREMKTFEAIRLLNMSDAKRKASIRSLGKAVCYELSLRIPKSWRYYYTASLGCLEEARRKAFAINQSRRRHLWKKKAKNWRPLSTHQRDNCFHWVKTSLIKKNKGTCPTINDILREWRGRMKKWKRKDARIFGHCKTLLGKLRSLNWNKRTPSERTSGQQRSVFLRIASLNIGGGLNNVSSVVAQYSKDVDIFCFQETWHLPSVRSVSDIPPGWKVFLKARDCDEMHRGGGLCIIARGSIQVKVLNRNIHGEHSDEDGESLGVRICFGSLSCVVWNVYLPREAYHAAPHLVSNIVKSGKENPVVLVGDFNWNALALNAGPDTLARKKTWYRLAEKMRLTFVNKSLGPTFSREGTSSLLDHIWCETSLRPLDPSVTESGYEHKLLKFVIRTTGATSHGSDQSESIVRRIRWIKLRDLSSQPLRDQLNSCLLRSLRRFNPTDADDFVSLLQEAALKTCSLRKVKKPNTRFESLPFWNDELSRLLRSLRTTRRKLLAIPQMQITPADRWNRARYLRHKTRVTSQAFRRSLRKCKSGFFRELKCEWWRQRRVPRYVWNWFSGEGHRRSERRDDSIPFATQVMNDAWARIISIPSLVCEDHWASKVASFLDDAGSNCNSLAPTSTFSFDVLERSLSNLTLGKAAGLDDTPNEGFKYLDGPVLEFLYKIFHDILSGAAIPVSWKKSEVCLIPKVSIDELSPETFRPITLLPCVAKILESVVFDLIKTFVHDKKLDIVHCLQGGFQEGRSAIDQVWILRQVLEHQGVLRSDTCIAFLDIKKAYDTVPLFGLLSALIDAGLPGWFVSFVYRWAFGHKRILRVKGNITELTVLRGVPQGSVLAPFLFNVFIDTLLRRLDGKGCMIDSRWLGALLYADDIALLSSDPMELQEMIDICSSWSREVGMEFSVAKSKWMFCPWRMRGRTVEPFTDTFSFTLYDNAFDRVSHFPYLGIEILTKKSLLAKVDTCSRSDEVNTLFEERKRLLHPGYGLPIWVGRLIAQSLFWSKLWYGIELGAPFNRGRVEGQQFMNRTARAVLGTFQCTRVETMLTFLGWNDFDMLCHIRILSYFVRLIYHSHPIVTELLVTLVNSEERMKSSPWWKAFLKACRICEIEVPVFADEMSATRIASELEVLKSRILMFLDCSEKVHIEPHPSVKICGQNAVYVFIFLRGYFNPRVKGVFPSVPCWFCNEENGDTPAHLFDCSDDRVRSVLQPLISRSGVDYDVLKQLCLGEREWDGCSNQLMECIGDSLSGLYGLRWKVRKG